MWEILEKAKTPNGTGIQLEDFSTSYPSIHAYADTVAAYPIARESVDGYFTPKRGQKFRCEFEFETTEQARKCFEQLKNGEKDLKDFIEFLANKKFAVCL